VSTAWRSETGPAGTSVADCQGRLGRRKFISGVACVNETVITNLKDLERLIGNIQPIQNVHLGDMLVDEGIITPRQLEDALVLQRRNHGKHLGRLLTEMGLYSVHQTG
jgi:hypothetical protein